MTDDIVTRLREIADADVYRADISVSKLYEAADEIERLRTEVLYWKSLPYCPRCGCGQCQDNEQVLNNE